MNRLKFLLKIALPMALCLGSLSALAATSDDQQPIHVTADSAAINYQAGVGTYNGNVIVTQGTRKLTADKIIIHRNQQGQVDKITAYGAPARYQALPDVSKGVVHAKANIMIYQPLQHLFTLQDNAEVEQNGNVSQAPLITYNTLTEVVSSPASSEGRTTMIIQPYSQQQQ
jgi:lipopolysaccharide export system protein LptA